jgi:hypothetical protein
MLINRCHRLVPDRCHLLVPDRHRRQRLVPDRLAFCDYATKTEARS